MLKRINPQALLEFFCFAFFALLIVYLTASGRYLSYVTPKMAPYLYFTSAVMFGWSVSKFPRMFQPQHKTRAAHCLVLAIPIFLLLLPLSPVSASGVSSAGFNGGIGSASGNAAITEASTNWQTATQGGQAAVSSPVASSQAEAGSNAGDRQSQASSAADTSSNSDTSGTTEKTSANSGDDDSLSKQDDLLLSKDGSVQVSDAQFYPWLQEIFTNIKRYEGAKITMKGFVFKDPTCMKAKEFIPARLLMWCCSADLTPCGIVCEYDKSADLKKNTWVTVTGVIHLGKYQGKPEPQITVTSVKPAEKPKEEYVYPW